MLKLSVLPARRGDCFILEFGEKDDIHYIIIDSGEGDDCYRKLKQFFYDLNREQKTLEQHGKEHIPIVDMVILTHYDSDHINGFIKLLSKQLIKKT